MNKKYFFIIISLLIISIIVALVVIKFTTHVFDKKQPDKKTAIEQGYGYYTNPIQTACQNKDGGTDCGKDSTYKVIFHCIANPNTQKGCIADDGTITYNSKIEELPCDIPCVNSYFKEQEGLELKPLGSDGENFQVTGAGCNKIINKNNGLDYTDYYFGNFLQDKGFYENKNCVPNNSDYVGYKQTVLTCTENKNGGKNNCNVTCGNIQTINLNGVFGSKLSRNVLQYFPTEYDQDGIRRNVCYDLNGVNQIEILNVSQNVPSDFIFPDKCFALYNNKPNIQFSDYWPIGEKATSQENFYYTDSTNYFLLDIDYNNLANIIDTGKIYPGMYQNYLNFVKVRLGEEMTILENMHSNNFSTTIEVSSGEQDNYFGNFYYPNPVPSSYQRKGSGTTTLTTGICADIDGISYSQLDSQINDIFRSNTPTSVDYFYSGVSSILYFENLPSYVEEGTYIYYVDKKDYYNNSGKLTKVEGTSIGSSIAYMSEKLIPYSDYQDMHVWVAYGVSVPGDFRLQDLYSTGKFHLQQGKEYSSLNKATGEIEVYRKNISEIGTSAYYYYGITDINSQYQFYYPLYGTSSSSYGVSYSFGDLILYGDNDSAKQIGPSASDIYSLEIELGTVKVDPKIAQNSNIPYGFNVVQPGINYQTGEKLYQSDLDYGVSLTSNTLSQETKTFVQLLRASSLKLDNVIPGDTEQEKRILNYYSLVRDNIPLENLDSETIDISILEEKNYTITADYEIFRSPYIIEDDGSINKICYDENNKVKTNGTVVNLQPGDKVYYNSLCTDYNFDPQTSFACGQLVIENTNNACRQTAEDNDPAYVLDCKPVNKNETYFNVNGFLEQGFNITDRKLKCDSEKCQEPFFTREFNQISFYQKNQEVYIDREEKNYFLSLVDNNSFDPLNPQYWDRIYNYSAGENVKLGEKFFVNDKSSDTLFIYECTKDGIAPFNLEFYSVNYQYKKEQPVYGTLVNIGISTDLDIKEFYGYGTYFYRNPANYFNYNDLIQKFFSSYTLAGEFPITKIYQKFINNSYSVDYGISSTYPNSLELELRVENLSINQKDIYTPGFGIWNNFFINLIADKKNTNNYSEIALTYYAGTMSNSIKNGQHIETITNNYVTNGLKIKKDDYYIAIPSPYDIDYIYPQDRLIFPNNIDEFVYSLLTVNEGLFKPNQERFFSGCTYNVLTPGPSIGDHTLIDSNNYLPEFELIKINETDYNGHSTSFLVSRNFNQVSENNLLNNQEMINLTTSAYDKLLLFYAPPGIVNLNYDNFNIDGDTTTFTIKSNVNESLGVSPGTIVNTGMVSDGVCWSSFTGVSNLQLTDDFGINNYYVSRFNKSTVIYPTQEYQNNTYYITNNNYESQVYSIMTEIYPESSTFYMNEYKIGDNTNFNLTDVIGINVNGNDYDFVVNATKVRVNEKNYDYRCTLQNGTSTKFLEDFRTGEGTNIYQFSGTSVLYIPSVIYRDNLTPNHFYFSFVEKNLYNGTITIEHTEDGTKSDIPSGGYVDLGLEPYLQLKKFSGTSPGDYNNYAWQDNFDNDPAIAPNGCSIGWYNSSGYINPGLSANNIDYDEICKYQYMLDKGELATFSLKETNFYANNNENSVTVKINQVEGKPPGPSYIKKLPQSNTIDKTGYGHILDFQFLDIDNNNIVPGDYRSKGGFILSSTLDQVAEFKFITSGNNFTSFSVYNGETEEYSINQAIEYTNYNERSYFRNIDGKDTFDQKEWQPITETIYPQNDVILSLDNDRIYYPEEIVRFDNTLYGVCATTLGSKFPTNFAKINRAEVFSTEQNQYYFETNTGSSPTENNINDFIINNNQNLPLIYQDYEEKDVFYCPNSCYGISYIDINSQTFLTKINTDISYDFYNNVYVASYTDNAEDEFWSLSNTPVAKNNNDTITFLQNTEYPFSANLYSQYVFDIPRPSVVKNGSIECSGSCFTLNNIVFSNSLLFTIVPQDIEYQDRIKYIINEESGVSNRFIQPSSNIPVPIYLTNGISMILQQGQTYTRQNLQVTHPASYISQRGDFERPANMKKGEYLEMTLTKGTSTIGISPYYDDIYYHPLGKASVTNSGTSFKFGEIWYVLDNDEKVVSHGYLDPQNASGNLEIPSFVPIQLPNEDALGISPYSLNFVTENGKNFSHTTLDYEKRNFIFGVDIGVSSTNNGEYSTNHYYYNGTSVHFGTSFKINYTNQPGNNILQKSIGVSNISENLQEDNVLYQRNEREDINVKMYSLFSSEYLSSVTYDPSVKITNFDGDDLPAMVYQPLRNDFFSPDSYTDSNQTEVFYGTSSTQLNGVQNIFLLTQQGTSYTFKCNPYIYPLNNQNNYNIEIGGAENPSIFNKDSIYQSQLSNLNIIRSTNPSTLNGKACTGVSLNAVETINELFFKDLFTDENNFGLTNRDLLFKQLRSNNNSEFKDSPLNCTMFYSEREIIGPPLVFFNRYNVTFSKGQYFYTDNETKKLVDGKDLNCKTNFTCQLNQGDMTSNPILLYTDAGVSITNTGAEDPYIVGNDKLYIYYFIDNYPISRKDYIDANTFSNPVIKTRFINITYQSQLDDDTRNQFVVNIKYNQTLDNNGDKLTFTV